ncbi:MAG: metal ABC transporter substrate-binding protein [Oscillospiraceae bacterium]|nr:metal ABC transporter substrate-binding protein [Oscillospiraceae bacterium]
MIKKSMAIALNILTVFALTVSLSACGPDAQQRDDSKLRVVCTLFPQYDFIREITGGEADVTMLLPAGAESHSFEPTPADIVRLNGADLFVYIGGEMETWAAGILPEVSGATAVINVSESLGLRLSGEGAVDPHIWTNPLTAVRMVELLCDALMEMDPEHAAMYAGNAGAYIARLKALDASVRTLVESAARRELVFASEFAIKNFTEEYGLTCLSVFDSCAHEAEPSAAAVMKAVDEIRLKELPAVFFGELSEPKTAKAIAAETGAEALLFHSCHNLSKDDFGRGETYLTLMAENLENLQFALY